MTDPTTFSGQDLGGARFTHCRLGRASFTDCDLGGVRITSSNLSGVRIRGVDISGTEIDDPWLTENGDSLLVNGVDVTPYVEAELDKRYPGRAHRTAADPDGLRRAWAEVCAAWEALVARAEAMPPGTLDASIDGEWSFAQTLRHLVTATDIWLRGAVLRIESPMHPLGVPHVEYESDGYDMSVFSTEVPTFAEVTRVRAERVAMVAAYLAEVTPEQLEDPRPSPWDPDHTETVSSCLHTILGEEWEHLRFADRDLTILAARPEGRGMQ